MTCKISNYKRLDTRFTSEQTMFIKLSIIVLKTSLDKITAETTSDKKTICTFSGGF